MSILNRRFSRRALYQQVRDVLATRIATAEWRPGIALPSEADLARELGVSAGTARKALKLLEEERLLTRRMGHGTFVNGPGSEGRALRYDNIFAADGQRIDGEVKVLRVSDAPATAAQREELQLQPADLVCHIQWVSTFEGEPFMVEEASMPAALFPGLAERKDFSRPIASLAQEFGLLLGRAEERLHIGAATPEIARLLKLTDGAPILVLNRIVRTIEGTPVEWRLRRANLADKYYEAGFA